MNTTKQDLLDEMKWAKDLYLSTGKNLGVTYFDLNEKEAFFNQQLESVMDQSNDEKIQIHQDPSKISFH